MNKIDHIGVAVRDLNAEIERHKKDFSAQLELREIVKDQEVEIAFLKYANTRIELLSPTSPSSKLEKFLVARGPGLHHICFEVVDLKQELARLSKCGYQLIDTAPRPGANNTLIAFIHPKSCGGVLTELCEYRSRA